MGEVSIPERVLGGLERTITPPCALPPEFQSLKGFWVVWNLMDVRCERGLQVFQSLKGFWVVWNVTGCILAPISLAVSIPERVLGGLELQ